MGEILQREMIWLMGKMYTFVFLDRIFGECRGHEFMLWVSCWYVSHIMVLNKIIISVCVG